MTRQILLILIGFLGGIVTNLLSRYLNFFWEMTLYVFFAGLALYAGLTEPIIVNSIRGQGASLAVVVTLFSLIWLLIGAGAVTLVYRHYNAPSDHQKELALRTEIIRLIRKGETTRNSWRDEYFALQSGVYYNSHIEYYWRTQIEKWREQMQDVLRTQTVLRPEVLEYVDAVEVDRISSAIARLREVLKDWDKWKR